MSRGVVTCEVLETPRGKGRGPGMGMGAGTGRERERARLDDVTGKVVDAASDRDDVHFSRGEAEMEWIQEARVVGES